MIQLLSFLVTMTITVANDLPPSCHKPVYCGSELLHHVQMARLYTDSKTFVDLKLRTDENATLLAFDELLYQTNGKPTKEDLKLFVDKMFEEADELENWTPDDFVKEPDFLEAIQDEDLKQYAKVINAIWPALGKKIKKKVFDSPELYSLIPVTNGFIIPGGRFRETYYWDSYWIIKGLLICGMNETARGMIDNLIQLLNKLGHVPNGSRWYYQERSQPPLLTAMMHIYIRFTGDMDFLRKNMVALTNEMEYWLGTQIVTFEKDGETYTMLKYYSPSAGPRPESYYEDFLHAQIFDSENRQQEFYTDIKSAAESGWDFSSRWFRDNNGSNGGNMTNIHTKEIVPVDLNAIFASALKNMAIFEAVLGNSRRSLHWEYLATQWRSNIERVFWDEKDGIWYDYDVLTKKHRKFFYPSNISPLWAGVVSENIIRKHADKILKYMSRSHSLEFPGGVPTSLNLTGEQWDFPNAWPPLVSIVINALEALDTLQSKEIAFRLAQTWVRASYSGFTRHKQLFEKYDVRDPGSFGMGGEYKVQEGFGWSNGVVLEMIRKYGKYLTLSDLNIVKQTTA